MSKNKIGKILLNIYRLLLACYGPQHWWPAETPFEVVVGAILTQSASWTNVEKAIANLKAAGALSPSELRRLPAEKIAELIHPSGYYNMKALKLKSFVEFFSKEYGDSLERMAQEDVSILREKLLKVHGIGEETADSIILYAVGKPVFVIDAYTRRIVDRIGLDCHSGVPRLQSGDEESQGGGISSRRIPGKTKPRASYSAYQSLFMDNLPHDVHLFNEYHALLVQHGKHTCKKKPVCERCCVREICPSLS